MLKTFNSGIGMILAVAADSAAEIETLLTSQGETVIRLGLVTPGEACATLAGCGETRRAADLGRRLEHGKAWSPR